MTHTTLLRAIATIGVLGILCAPACKRDRGAPGIATPAPGAPGAPTPRRRWTPIPTRIPPTHVPGQPTPLPELPG